VSRREQVWKEPPPRQWQWADYCKETAMLSALVYRPTDEGEKAVLAPFEKRLGEEGWKRSGVCDRTNQPPGEGLYFEVWENRRVKPRKIILAFRGTEFRSGLDWQANLRWFWPRNAGDRYGVARSECRSLIERLYGNDPEDRPEIITAGHSLGGGIAQGVFYANAMKVDHCIVYDPSPVTGYYDLASEVRNQYEWSPYRPLFSPYRVVRAYERGEILAYVRNILGAFYKQSSLTHAIELKSKGKGGNPIKKHSIVTLAQTILDTADQTPRAGAEVPQTVFPLPSSAYRPDPESEAVR
jgi:hypothetical protein